MVIGVVFLILGILGLILDTTHGSILGFQVDLVHNLVHLVTGILGIAAAMTGWSRLFNQVFGIIYLLLGLAGLIPALYFGHRLLGLIQVNTADNVLHLPPAGAKAPWYAHKAKRFLYFTPVNTI
jgi:hypothetical protein